MTTVTNETTAKEVGDIFLSKNIDRVIFANLDGSIICSNPEADFMINIIRESGEWRNHEAVLMKVDGITQCIYIVSIHSTVRGRPEGGVRLRTYPSFSAGLNDCLALSYGMTEKNAYAEIWEGGAKSVIIPFDERTFQSLMEGQAKTEKEKVGPFRELLWKNYGGFNAEMQGLYLVGEDMNLNEWDMRSILRYDVHSSCHSELVGGAGNPSPKTAKGIFNAIVATCEVAFLESPSIKGKRIILKGIGLVGESLAEQLLESGANLQIYDTDSNADTKFRKLKGRFADGKAELKIIDSLDSELEYLRSTEADIFSPNAKSGTLTRDLIDVLKVKAIVGAENAQIAKNDVKDIIARLRAKGMIYIPEPCVNFMGVFSAYQEHIGILRSDFDKKAAEIYHKTKELLEKAKVQNKTPYDIFIDTALRNAAVQNPILGHRGIEIIKELLESWRPKNEKHEADRAR